MKRILVLSNGHGEDSIAGTLIEALYVADAHVEIEVMPLVGGGHEFEEWSLNTLLKNPVFPSGGFIRTFSDLCKDIRAGLLRHIWKQYKVIQRTAKTMDAVICVGDVFCLVMGTMGHRIPAYFLPTAKSDRFMPHSWIEKIWIKYRCRAVFPRDSQTAKTLSQYGIHATYLGNPMMDVLGSAGDRFGFLPKQPVVGLLPGSREEAYENLVYFFTCVQALAQQYPYGLGFICAKARSLTYDMIQVHCEPLGWILTHDGTEGSLSHPLHHITIIITEKFADVLHVSSVLLGLSGTANEQAVYYGKRVICFEGFGPQSTLQRFSEQKKLVGEGLIVVHPRDVQSIVQTVMQCLQRPALQTNQPDTSPFSKAAHAIVTHIRGQAI